MKYLKRKKLKIEIYKSLLTNFLLNTSRIYSMLRARDFRPKDKDSKQPLLPREYLYDAVTDNFSSPQEYMKLYFLNITRMNQQSN